MELLVLGSGTCDPSPERGCAGYILKLMGKTFLIDAGPGTHRQLCKMGIDLASISEIFITHFHVDHVNDLAAVLFSMVHCLPEKGRDDLLIHGPEGFKENFESLTKLYGTQLTPKGFSIDVKEHGETEKEEVEEEEEVVEEEEKVEEVEETEEGKEEEKEEDDDEEEEKPKEKYDRGSVKLETMPMNHGMASIGYRFDDGNGKSFIYSGDTAPCKEIVELAKGGQCLLMECTASDDSPIEGHSTLSQAAEIAKEAGVKTLVLTHIKPENDTTDLDQKAAKIFDGTVFVARDGMRVTI